MSSEHRSSEDSARVPSEASKLAELRGHEERLEALRARRTDLEVERIVARTALRSARTGAEPEAAGADAAAIVDALDRLRRLESQPSAHLAAAGTGARSHEELIERLRAGDEALGAWLDADRDDAAASSGGRTAKQALLVACLAIVVLAVAVHLAFLVLLVPVGGAMSFLLWTGQDRSWRRIGARRRFERLRLEAPAAWTEDAVRERRHALARLAEQVRERASAPGGESTAEERERPGADLDAARSELQDAFAAVGLDADRLDGSTEAALRAIARVHHAEQALREVVEEMAVEREQADAIREPLYRDIARDEGTAPDGDASAGALAARVESLRRR